MAATTAAVTGRASTPSPARPPSRWSARDELGLGGRELVLAEHALGLEVREVLDLRRQVVATCRRRGRCLGVGDLRLRLLLLVHLLLVRRLVLGGVLRLLVVPYCTRGARDHGRRRGRPHQSTSASKHRCSPSVSICWVRAGQ